MAAPPMKSQPLHNFSLPTLRWAHKNSSSSPAAAAAAGGGSSRCHRRRDSPDQLHETDSDNETQPPNPSQQTPTQNDPVPAVADEGNGEAKPWNLRPRKEAPAVKAASKSRKEARAECNESKISSINNGGVKSQRIRGMAAAEGGQRNGGAERNGGSRKIWISLSKEEIEEDIYAMTGGKPSRRPRKWPRNVQKQLDNVFPGLYLVGVAADSYRVSML
ncbi:hypothetical protein ACP275_08G151000 [Erythranthe tilingii]